MCCFGFKLFRSPRTRLYNLVATDCADLLIGRPFVHITQDGKVLGDDINRWLAIRNGGYTLPPPLTQLMLLDQKRNGIVAGEDITRGIQLINSMGIFRVWSGFDLGVRP